MYYLVSELDTVDLCHNEISEYGTLLEVLPQPVYHHTSLFIES